ncbi:vacuole protein [Phaffia rhodozyma]|uniref:Phosphatidylglycerol/phosphatidylinositol transfer protein n=1 Tax=Phaffia rhodozyma TaxID=264483 RepID=A0A0F7SF50_PHARH|nr:vacuole protein [Phaffia rhodozyma]
MPQVDSLVGLASWGAEAISGIGRGKVNTFPEGGWSWVDCGVAGDAVQVESINISPDPPVPGKNLTVSVKGVVIDPINEGSYADVLVKLGLIKLLQKRFDVCDEAENANATVQCPVSPGSYEVSQTVELPKEIPRAKFAIQVRGVTAEDKDMLCLDLFIDFLHRKPALN